MNARINPHGLRALIHTNIHRETAVGGHHIICRSAMKLPNIDGGPLRWRSQAQELGNQFTQGMDRTGPLFRLDPRVRWHSVDLYPIRSDPFPADLGVTIGERGFRNQSCPGPTPFRFQQGPRKL
jgi:hypothetical protein